MILDIKKLKRSGKDSSDFFFEYQANNELIDIPSVTFSGEIKINGTATLAGPHSVYIDGEVEFALVGECTRCCEKTTKSFIVEFSESASADDETSYPVKNDTVDLSKIIDDLVAMNIPVNFLCREDCKGLCSGCGTNLNDGDCKCKNK